MGGCPGGQKGSEHKDSPFQPAENQACLAKDQHGQNSCTKPSALKHVAGRIQRYCQSRKVTTLKLKLGRMWKVKVQASLHFSKRKAKNHTSPGLKEAGHVLTQ